MKMLKILIASFLMVSLSASQGKAKDTYSPKGNFTIPYPEHGEEEVAEILESYRNSSSFSKKVNTSGASTIQSSSSSIVENPLLKTPRVKDLK